MTHVWSHEGADSGYTAFLAVAPVSDPVVLWRRKSTGASLRAGEHGVFVVEEGDGLLDGQRMSVWKIRCLDPHTGKVRRTIDSRPGEYVHAFAVVGDALLVVRTASSNLWTLAAYDARTGTQRSEWPLEGRHRAFLDDATYLAATEHELIALDVASNERVFSIDLRERAAWSESALASPLGILLHGRTSGTVELCDRASGASLFRLVLEADEVFAARADAAGAVVSIKRGKMSAIAMIDANGRLRWTFEVPGAFMSVNALGPDFVLVNCDSPGSTPRSKVLLVDRESGSVRRTLAAYEQGFVACSAVREGAYLPAEPSGLAFVPYDGGTGWTIEDRDVLPRKHFYVAALANRAYLGNGRVILCVASRGSLIGS